MSCLQQLTKITFQETELQAVLYSQLFLGKPLFYKRRPETYNFTIFKTVKREGHCLDWQETQGNRGSIEIGIAYTNS